METLNKINYYIEKILSVLIVISFSILIISCVLQVFTRFVLNNSLSWTEELARYAFIWSNLLGAAVCTQKNSHATVTVITDMLSKRKKAVLNIIVNIIVILVCYVLIRYGFKVAFAVRTQLSPALRISMMLVYLAAPISGLLIMFYSVVHLFEDMALISSKEGK